MSAQHTPGRMTVHIDGDDGWPLLMIGGPAGRIVANVNAESGVDTSKAPSIAFKTMPAAGNARRLAACWNACEGLSTDLLDNIVLVGETLASRFKLRDETERALETQRDELLAALEQVKANAGSPEKVYQLSSAAIAKATGSAS